MSKKKRKKKLSAKEQSRRKWQRQAVQNEVAAKKAEGQYGIHTVPKNVETTPLTVTEKT